MKDVFTKVQNLIQGKNFYDKESYKTAQSFCEFPIITKDDILEYYNNCKYYGKDYHISYTSGSTGSPMKVTWRFSDYLQSITPLWRIRKKYGITSNDCCLTCHCGYIHNGDLLTEAISTYGKYLSLSKLYLSNEQIDEYIRYIEIFSPKWIYAQPSFVYQLGLFLVSKRPNILNQFSYIELVGESVDTKIKAQIQSMFPNATVVEMYGLQEFNCVLIEDNGKMKPCSDDIYIEILTDDYNVCDVGQEGNIVLTGMKNSLLPLVRYNTEDKGKRIINEGQEYFVITRGRSNDNFFYKNHTYDGSIFFSVITKYNMSNQQKISNFQVVQTQEGLLFNVIGFSEILNKNDIKKAIVLIMKNDYGIEFPVFVSVKNNSSEFIQDDREKEKIKYFINLI